MTSKCGPVPDDTGKGSPEEITWELALYVAGQTPRSIAACANLNRICEEHLQGRYHIQVIDVLEDPQRARTDQILAVPTLVRRFPTPVRKVIGDLSNTEKVLLGLELSLQETIEVGLAPVEQRVEDRWNSR